MNLPRRATAVTVALIVGLPYLHATAQPPVVDAKKLEAERKVRLDKLQKARSAENAQLATVAAQAFDVTNSKQLSKQSARSHTVLSYGTTQSLGPSATGLDAALAPYKSSFSGLQARPKRVLVNRQMVLVQGVLSGTQKLPFNGAANSGRTVRADMFQLHWRTNNEILQSVIYVPSEIVRLQITSKAGADSLFTPQAPAKHEVFTAPTVKVTKEMVAPIYGMASLAVASRLAWLDGHEELLRPLLGEVSVAKFDANTRKRLQVYANALPGSKISIENLSASGPFIIAQLKFRGRHTRALGPYPATNREIKLDLLTVARVAADKVDTAQTYINESLLVQQLK